MAADDTPPKGPYPSGEEPKEEEHGTILPIEEKVLTKDTPLRSYGSLRQPELPAGEEKKVSRTIGGALYSTSDHHRAVVTTQESPADGTYGELGAYEYKASVAKAEYDSDKRTGSVSLVDAQASFTAEHLQLDVADKVRGWLGLEDHAPKAGQTFAPFSARVGDPTSHGTPLYPGTGSPDVWIGGRPAWRTEIDVHVCPRAHPPHGQGVVLMGSSTVFINSSMAVRAGDFVAESRGGRNYITAGCPTVRIGVEAAPAGLPEKEFHYADAKVSMDVGRVEGSAKLGANFDLNQKTVDVGGEVGARATFASARGEGKIHVPIPFTSYNVALGGSAEGSFLSIGGKAEAGLKVNEEDPETHKKVLFQAKAGAYLGAAVLGGGLGASFGVEHD